MQIHLRRIILVFQIVALAILLVVTLACSPDVAATFQNDHALTLDLACQPTELCWGDQLSVLASCENAGEVITVDLYLAVVLPDGDVFYFPDGSLSAPFIPWERLIPHCKGPVPEHASSSSFSPSLTCPSRCKRTHIT